MDVIGGWLKDETNAIQINVTLGSTFVQVFPADPNRFLLAFPVLTGMVLTMSFGETAGAGLLLVLPANPSWPYVTRDDLGEVLTRTVWAKTASAAGGQNFAAISWLPHRKRIYDEYVKHVLSKQLAL